MLYIIKNVKNGLFATVFLGILFLLPFIPLVFAGTGLTIQPIKISHTLNPGESVSGVISLTNASSDDIGTQITLKVEDFVPFAGQDGINFVGRAPGVTTAMDWITLGKDNEKTFVIEKSGSRGIPYSITAPLDAEPGGHYGVLFFKATKLGEGEQLNVGTQVAVLVLITIPGSHLQKGKILNFSTKEKFYSQSPVNYLMRFENTGTVHFEPKGRILIKNIFGSKVTEIPVEGNIVLPSGIREIPITWKYEGILLGRYTATVDIIGPEGDNIGTGTTVFYAAPLWYMGEFFGSIIVIYFILSYLRRRVKINISLN